MTVLDDIRRFWHIQQTMMGLSTKLEWVQRGGSIRYVGNHPIHIREVKDGKHIFIHGGPSKPCFCLELLLKERHAILQGVRRRPDCFVDKHSDSRNIVRAAVAFAKERGMITIELTDNSTIRCPERISLSDLSFLTTGKTWYESILPNLIITDTPNLELWRSRVLSNTWRKVGAGLPMFDTTGIDIDEPGSAMAVLARAKNSRTKCAAISANMDQLISQSGILSLDGRHWWGNLGSP
jgi:hypothetical protein